MIVHEAPRQSALAILGRLPPSTRSGASVIHHAIGTLCAPRFLVEGEPDLRASELLGSAALLYDSVGTEVCIAVDSPALRSTFENLAIRLNLLPDKVVITDTEHLRPYSRDTVFLICSPENGNRLPGCFFHIVFCNARPFDDPVEAATTTAFMLQIPLGDAARLLGLDEQAQPLRSWTDFRSRVKLMRTLLVQKGLALPGAKATSGRISGASGCNRKTGAPPPPSRLCAPDAS